LGIQQTFEQLFVLFLYTYW